MSVPRAIAYQVPSSLRLLFKLKKLKLLRAVLKAWAARPWALHGDHSVHQKLSPPTPCQLCHCQCKGCLRFFTREVGTGQGNQ